MQQYGLPIQYRQQFNQVIASLNAYKGNAVPTSNTYVMQAKSPEVVAAENSAQSKVDPILFSEFLDITGDGKTKTNDYVIYGLILLLTVALGYIIFKEL